MNASRPPCKFFAQGRCNKGSKCKFSHSTVRANGSGVFGSSLKQTHGFGRGQQQRQQGGFGQIQQQRQQGGFGQGQQQQRRRQQQSGFGHGQQRQHSEQGQQGRNGAKQGELESMAVCQKTFTGYGPRGVASMVLGDMSSEELRYCVLTDPNWTSTLQAHRSKINAQLGNGAPGGGGGDFQPNAGFNSGGFGGAQVGTGFGSAQKGGGVGLSQTRGGFGSAQKGGGFGYGQNGFKSSTEHSSSTFASDQADTNVAFGSGLSGFYAGAVQPSMALGSSGLDGRASDVASTSIAGGFGSAQGSSQNFGGFSKGSASFAGFDGTQRGAVLGAASSINLSSGAATSQLTEADLEGMSPEQRVSFKAFLRHDFEYGKVPESIEQWAAAGRG